MGNDYEQIIGIVRKLQTEQAKDVETQLQNYKGNPSFSNILLTIMKQQSLEETLKISSAIILNNYIQEGVVEKPESYSFNLLADILSDRELTSLQKRSFQRSLIRLLQYSSQDTVVKFQQLTNHLLQQSEFDSAYFLIACIGVANLAKQFLFSLIKETYQFTLQKVPLNLSSANLINELIKTWIVIFDKLCEKQDGEFILLQVVNSKSLLNVIDWVFRYQSSQNGLVCFKEQLDQLNLLKFEASQLLHRVINYGHMTQTASGAFEYVKSILNIIFKTLSISYPPDTNSNNFATCLVKILIVYCRNFPNQEFQFWSNICEYIIYPKINANKDQMNSFQDDYDEFNSLMEDCCDKQTSEVMKTELAKLLQTIGDTMHNSIQYSISRSVQSIKSQLGIPVQKWIGNYPIKIETSFLVICINAYRLSKFPHLIQQLRGIILHSSIEKLSPFQLGRFYQFLGYCFTDIFPDPNHGKSIIQKALQQNSHPTTVLCALDFVSNVADEYYSEEFFKIISDNVITCSHMIIWQILSKTIYSHHQKISVQALCYLINKVFIRIDYQLEMLSDNKKKSTLSLVNSLHLLRRIIESKKSQDKYVLKELIWKATEYLFIAAKYDVQDQIILIIYQFIQETQTIIEPYEQILPKVLQTFEKQNFTSTPYFILLNQYIMKGNIVIVRPIYEMLLKGFSYYMNNCFDNKKKIKQKVIIGNHLILLQNIIANYGNEMSWEKQFQSIYNICIKILSPSQEQLKSIKILVGRVLNLLFLCYMHDQNQQKNSQILNFLLNYHTMKVFKGYDAQVILLCLQKQIMRSTDPTLVCHMLSIMVNINSFLKVGKPTKNKAIKLKQERIQMYEAILKSIKVPFQTNMMSCDIIMSVVGVMKKNNQNLYSAIVGQMSSQTKERLGDILKLQKIQEGKPRMILKVSGAKNHKIDEQIHIQQGNINQDQQQQQQQQVSYKRERMKVKREKQ